MDKYYDIIERIREMDADKNLSKEEKKEIIKFIELEIGFVKL